MAGSSNILAHQSPPSTKESAEFEPSNEWKEALKVRIGEGLQSMRDDALRSLNEMLTQGPVSAEARATLEQEYKDSMQLIKTISAEQFHYEVEKERESRRWAAGQAMRPGWGEGLVREQQYIMDTIQRQDANDNSSDESTDESEPIEASPVILTTHEPPAVPTYQGLSRSNSINRTHPSQRPSRPSTMSPPFVERPPSAQFSAGHASRKEGEKKAQSIPVTETPPPRRPSVGPIATESPSRRTSIAERDTNSTRRPSLLDREGVPAAITNLPKSRPEVWMPTVTPEEDAALSKHFVSPRRNSNASVRSVGSSHNYRPSPTAIIPEQGLPVDEAPSRPPTTGTDQDRMREREKFGQTRTDDRQSTSAEKSDSPASNVNRSDQFSPPNDNHDRHQEYRRNLGEDPPQRYPRPSHPNPEVRSRPQSGLLRPLSKNREDNSRPRLGEDDYDPRSSPPSAMEGSPSSWNSDTHPRNPYPATTSSHPSNYSPASYTYDPQLSPQTKGWSGPSKSPETRFESARDKDKATPIEFYSEPFTYDGQASSYTSRSLRRQSSLNTPDIYDRRYSANVPGRQEPYLLDDIEDYTVIYPEPHSKSTVSPIAVPQSHQPPRVVYGGYYSPSRSPEIRYDPSGVQQDGRPWHPHPMLRSPLSKQSLKYAGMPAPTATGRGFEDDMDLGYEHLPDEEQPYRRPPRWEESRLREEARIREEEEAKKREDAIRQQAEEVRQREEQLKRREDELLRREIEAKLKDELRAKEDDIRRREEELRRKEQEAEERRRKEAAEEEKRKREAEEERAKVIAEQKQKAIEAEEAARLQAEEKKKKKEENERIKLVAKERRMAALEAERKREEEEKRCRIEAQARMEEQQEALAKIEAEQMRKEAELRAAEEEQRRKEEDRAQKEAEERRKRIEEAAKERARIESEERRKRLEAEAEEQARLQSGQQTSFRRLAKNGVLGEDVDDSKDSATHPSGEQAPARHKVNEKRLADKKLSHDRQTTEEEPLLRKAVKQDKPPKMNSKQRKAAQKRESGERHQKEKDGNEQSGKERESAAHLGTVEMETLVEVQQRSEERIKREEEEREEMEKREMEDRDREEHERREKEERDAHEKLAAQRAAKRKAEEEQRKEMEEQFRRQQAEIREREEREQLRRQQQEEVRKQEEERQSRQRQLDEEAKRLRNEAEKEEDQQRSREDERTKQIAEDYVKAMKLEEEQRQGQRRMEDLWRQEDELRRRAEQRKRQDSGGSSQSSWSASQRTAHNAGAWSDRSSTGSSTWSAATGSPWASPSTGQSRKPTSPSTASTSYQSTTPMSEAEWQRRQAEQARKQQEAFRKEQERLERERQQKAGRIMTREDINRIFECHEAQRSRLRTLDVISWDDFPWPMLKQPTLPEEITSFAISAYVLNPYYPDRSKSEKDRVKEHIRHWHPDRFETKLLSKVPDSQRDKVKMGAGFVVRSLNDLLTRSNSHSDGSSIS